MRDPRDKPGRPDSPEEPASPSPGKPASPSPETLTLGTPQDGPTLPPYADEPRLPDGQLFRVPADSELVEVREHHPTAELAGSRARQQAQAIASREEEEKVTARGKRAGPAAPAGAAAQAAHGDLGDHGEQAPAAPDEVEVLARAAPGDLAEGGAGLDAPAGDFDHEEDHRTDVWQSPEQLALQSGTVGGEESHIIGGRYRITEGLALGGMGAVFKVTHLKLQKTFALKIILTELSANQNMQRYFFREARVLSKLEHPSIVQVTDFGHDERFGAYLVMEYLHGESLFERLQHEEKLPIGVALQIGLQLAEALDYLHSRALIHCDIKPENVFLCSDAIGAGGGEAVKVIDFGLSRSMVRGARLDATEVGGTPAYSSPEQLAGRSPQPSMDIYGVGVLLYAMVTGWPPFSGSVDEILEAKRTQEPVPPSERLGRRLDAQLESLLVRCLAREPQKRPASMAQLIAELRGQLVRMGYGVPESSQERHRPITGKHNVLGEAPSALLERCPMPMFLVDPRARVLTANPSLCQVLETPLEQLLGARLPETRLGRIYPQVAEDLQAASRQSLALMRRIEFKADFKAGAGQRSALYLWLSPELQADGSVQRYWGILMPA